MTSSKCHLCQMVDPSTSCTVEGRVFVDSDYRIAGIIPGCPMKELRVNWWLVPSWFLVGTVEVGSKTVNCAEQREVNGAERVATLLGLLGEDLRTTGLWQDEEAAEDVT